MMLIYPSVMTLCITYKTYKWGEMHRKNDPNGHPNGNHMGLEHKHT